MRIIIVEIIFASCGIFVAGAVAGWTLHEIHVFLKNFDEARL